MKPLVLLAIGASLILSQCVRAADSAAPTSRDDVLAETLVPYTGPTVHAVDTSTLTGKLMCGYQGWFCCEGDGAHNGWGHWVKGRGIPSPSNIKVDLWPEVSELAPEERFDTDLHLADGRVAQVFSSFKRETVLRHFRWMQTYGIDGVFVQRFSAGVRSPRLLLQKNTVLAHCREGANLSGRTYALMYDLSGMQTGHIDDVMDDWRSLRTRMHLCDDPAYLHDHGKPVVAVWGIGFNDHRAYTLDECKRLIQFLKNDPQVGGCTVMVGVPTYWREQKTDTVSDPALHDVIAAADIVSPWTVGRYQTPDQATGHVEKNVKPDMAWCTEHHIAYLPVVFPGFSWHNMYGAPLNAIPRRRGQFFWTQICQEKRAGATMLYVAMFDEVDEGTAIFKCTNDVPISDKASFVTYEGMPSDYYLRLAGAGAKLLRGELSTDLPQPQP